MNATFTAEAATSELLGSERALRRFTCETGPDEHEAFAHEGNVEEVSADTARVRELEIYQTQTARDF
jgi:hypothetical protein